MPNSNRQEPSRGQQRHRGGSIAGVVAGSPAAHAGMKPGDRLLQLGQQELHDILDYQFYLEPGGQEAIIERAGERLGLILECSEEADPGIAFTAAIFDRMRVCHNRCLFCFVAQVPQGLRRPLYLKDDDFRLSFLHGNFITLNNLSEGDMKRLVEQRLSPLYVSVHAADAEVRAQLMGCSREMAALGLANLRRLDAAGIEVHAQIVLCSGINDGTVLHQTVTELAREYENIGSVGIVPAALGEGLLSANSGLCRIEESDCLELVESVSAWQQQLRPQKGCGFVYAADEFYLRAGVPLPPLAAYDDFAQYENGIGIAASFQEEAGELVPMIKEAGYTDILDGGKNGRIFLLTGTLAAPLMASVCGKLSLSGTAPFHPLIAENRLFGSHVTVTGLLGGADIMAAAGSEGLAGSDLLLLPFTCLESSGERFLDDLTLGELKKQLRCRVQVVNL